MGSADVTALHMPAYTETNPYLRNLISGLEETGVDVQLGSLADPNVFSIFRAVYRSDVDVVHLHWLGPFYLGDNVVKTAVKSVLLVIELLLLRLSGYTLVWTMHNLSPHDSNGRLERFYYPIIVPLVSRIIVHSESGKDAVADRYRLSKRTLTKFEIIPHGHYIDNYANEISKRPAREELDLDPDLPTFVFVGLVRPYKNITGLINGFSQFESNGHDAQLLIAGNAYDDEYERAIRDLLATVECDRIAYEQGFIPDDELQVYFNAADAVVLPFNESLTSGSAILSLSFERPIIVPRMGCLADLEPGSVYYDPQTETVLDGLERALEADLESLGSAGYTLVSNYDWERICRKTRTVYTR